MRNDLYLEAFFSALQPDPKIPIDEWADRYRVLPSESSAEPGRYRTDRMPYLREIARELSPQSRTHRVSVVKGTQLGFTELANNMIFTYADLYPCPMLMVLPTESLAATHAKDKLWPSIEKTPKVKERVYPRKKDGGSSVTDVRFPGGNLKIGYSFTTATFASASRRVVIKDDLDRWPDDVKGEGNPSVLADKRADAFPNKKIYANSSPTIKGRSKIWREWLDGSQALYMVPCPYCGGRFDLNKDRFVYEYEEEHCKLEGEVRCVCPHCGVEINESKKSWMLGKGRWEHKYPERSHKSYRLPSWYSPFLGWAEIVQEYLTAKKTLDEGISHDMIAWTNTREAEVWEEKIEAAEAHELEILRIPNLAPWEVPEKTAFLSMAVDVQMDHFWVDVWAHRYGAKAVSIRHQRVETWVEVEEVMRTHYRGVDDSVWAVRSCAVDSGYKTDEVYEFCAMNMDVAVPVKGGSVSMPNPWRITTLDNGLKLYVLNTEYFKDMFWAKVERSLAALQSGAQEKSVFGTHREAEAWYFAQLTSEYKKEEVDKKGRKRVGWVKRSEHIDNHLFDTATYNTFVGELLGIRFLQEGQEQVRRRVKRKKRPRSANDEYDYMV